MKVSREKENRYTYTTLHEHVPDCDSCMNPDRLVFLFINMAEEPTT